MDWLFCDKALPKYVKFYDVYWGKSLEEIDNNSDIKPHACYSLGEAEKHAKKKVTFNEDILYSMVQESLYVYNKRNNDYYCKHSKIVQEFFRNKF